MTPLSQVTKLGLFLSALILFNGCSPAPEPGETRMTGLVATAPSQVEAPVAPPTEASEPPTPTTRPTLPPTNTPLPTLPVEAEPTRTSPPDLVALLSPTATLDLPEESATPGTSMFLDPAMVNGIPVTDIIVVTDEVAANIRSIYARGQSLGRNGQAFSKLGDSLIATPSFFTQFDTGPYNLGVYSDLQPAIDHFAGSFERYGVALRPGLHAWGVFDPLWANKDWCQANEDLLSCEIRLNNPAVLLILLGTNDAGNPPGFDYNMRKVIEFTIDQGIIPVIVTKADRFEGPDNINNELLRQIAADFQVPLWDFDLVAGTIPGRGLTDDQVHLTMFPENDFTLPEAYQTGHGVHNLTGLMALEEVRQAIAP